MRYIIRHHAGFPPDNILNDETIIVCFAYNNSLF